MRLTLPITFISFSILAWWLVPKVLDGDLKPLLIIGFAFAFFLVKVLEPVWVGMVLSFLTIGISIPYPILEKLSIGTLIVVMVAFFVFVRDFWNKNVLPDYITQGWEGRLMLFVGAIIILRFIYDRPFSATYGTSGGGAQAVHFVIGTIAYFTMIKVAMRKWDVKKNLMVILSILVLSTIQIAISRTIAYGIEDAMKILGGFFGGNLWLLCPLLLSIAMYKQETNVSGLNHFKNIYVYLVVIMTFSFGLITPFRSRPFFALMLIMAVAAAFKKKMNVLLMAGTAVIAIFVFLPLIPDLKLPLWSERSLSTIRQVGVYGESLGEVGFQSAWRLNLIESAWEDDIKPNPLIGKGFTYSKSDFDLLAVMENIAPDEALVQSLALSSIYHNSVVQLAAVCGLPCATAFVLALFLSINKLYQYIRNKPHDQLFVLAAGVFGFFIVSIGQMLMNGTAENYLGLCVLMGFVKGLSLNEALNNPNAVAADT